MAKMHALFDELDEDGTGQLDVVEFKMILTEVAVADWVMATDAASGRPYYTNVKTRATRWTPPGEVEVNDWVASMLQSGGGGEPRQVAAAGARLIVKRQEGVRKHPKHGSDQMFVLKPGDVVNVEESRVGKDGVKRLKIKLDEDDPANKHHKDKHKGKSGWIRTSDRHGVYVEPAPGKSAPSLLGTSPTLDVKQASSAKKKKRTKSKGKKHTDSHDV
jgi:hypothetical protein